MTQEELNYKLFNTVYENNIDQVKEAISLGADVNLKNNEWDTVLMYTAYWGRTDIARLLIEHGTDINAVNKYGTTALIRACRHGHTDIVQLLIEHGADVNIKNDEGQTAMDILEERYPQKYQQLIEYMARKEQLDTEDSLTDPKQEQSVDWNI
ncbi:MAG: ankyrin repeat domain-containing protein [Syntrophomonadaceae bacterium]|nr:ankyrin repeat domain-containing protein [Syntrophomonadaceae bacterium]